MQKKLRLLSVTYAPGRHGVSIDVQPVLIDDERVVTEAEVEVTPAVEEQKHPESGDVMVAAKAAVTKPRFAGMEILT